MRVETGPLRSITSENSCARLIVVSANHCIISAESRALLRSFLAGFEPNEGFLARQGCLDELQLPAHLLERRERFIQIIPGVRCGQLATYTRLSLRHHRKTEPSDKNTLREQHVTHADGSGGFTQDHGDDRGLAWERPEPQLQQPLPEIARVLTEPLDSRGVGFQKRDARERTRGNGGWQGVGEELRTRALRQEIAHRRGGSDETAG